jgi:signal transduction histidine kinase
LYLTSLARNTEPADSIDALKEKAASKLNKDAPMSILDGCIDLINVCTNAKELIDTLQNIHERNSIIISDTGAGMSSEELTRNFLVIGTPSRKREVDLALERGDSKTPYLGEKGIGRLSAMRLGEKLRVETAKKNNLKLNCLDIDWSAFAEIDAMLGDIQIKPYQGDVKSDSNWSGTRIIIEKLSEDWNRQRLLEMAEDHFSRLTDPFEDQKNRPRIALFWNDDRISIPWMPPALLENAHAFVDGSYEILDGEPHLNCTIEVRKLGFPHPKETERYNVSLEDLESALLGPNGALPEEALKSIGPFSFKTYWYNRRLLQSIDGIGDLAAVRKMQERWSGILLFRDGFRVFPYGENDDDWLGLDRRALGRSGYTLNKTQFVGRVEISRVSNPLLVDQTNREGLRVNPEQQVLIGVMQYVIQQLLLRTIKSVEQQYNHQKVDLTEAKAEVASLEAGGKSALTRLRKVAPPEGDSALEELQQTLFEFSEFAAKARQRIEEVERESHQMIEMAGVGLMVEVVAHELARASENALENLEALRGKNVPEDIRSKLDSLRAQMKSLSKRVRILDPMSVSGRQRVEVFDLKELVKDTLEAHEAQFARHHIQQFLDLPAGPVRVRCVKGMVVQILENLISNSKYWLDMMSSKPNSPKPAIRIALSEGPPTIIYEDNGPGIASENIERVFRAFFSMKEKSKRRGLGLFIARECAEYMDGTLIIDPNPNPSTGRHNSFILELPNSAQI